MLNFKCQCHQSTEPYLKAYDIYAWPSRNVRQTVFNGELYPLSALSNARRRDHRVVIILQSVFTALDLSYSTVIYLTIKDTENESPTLKHKAISL